MQKPLKTFESLNWEFKEIAIFILQNNTLELAISYKKKTTCEIAISRNFLENKNIGLFSLETFSFYFNNSFTETQFIETVFVCDSDFTSDIVVTLPYMSVVYLKLLDNSLFELVKAKATISNVR